MEADEYVVLNTRELTIWLVVVFIHTCYCSEGKFLGFTLARRATTSLKIWPIRCLGTRVNTKLVGTKILPRYEYHMHLPYLYIFWMVMCDFSEKVVLQFWDSLYGTIREFTNSSPKGLSEDVEPQGLRSSCLCFCNIFQHHRLIL